MIVRDLMNEVIIFIYRSIYQCESILPLKVRLIQLFYGGTLVGSVMSIKVIFLVDTVRNFRLLSPKVLNIATYIVVPSFRKRILYIFAISVGSGQPLVNDIADVYCILQDSMQGRVGEQHERLT